MGGMGSINRQHITVMGLEPGPDLIHTAEALNMGLAGQSRLLAGGCMPGGLGGGSHGKAVQSPRPITSALHRQSGCFSTRHLPTAVLPDEIEARSQGITQQGLHDLDLQIRNPVAQTPHRSSLEPTGHN